MLRILFRIEKIALDEQSPEFAVNHDEGNDRMLKKESNRFNSCQSVENLIDHINNYECPNQRLVHGHFLTQSQVIVDLLTQF